MAPDESDTTHDDATALRIGRRLRQYANAGIDSDGDVSLEWIGREGRLAVTVTPEGEQIACWVASVNGVVTVESGHPGKLADLVFRRVQP